MSYSLSNFCVLGFQWNLREWLTPLTLILSDYGRLRITTVRSKMFSTDCFKLKVLGFYFFPPVSTSQASKGRRNGRVGGGGGNLKIHYREGYTLSSSNQAWGNWPLVLFRQVPLAPEDSSEKHIYVQESSPPSLPRPVFRSHLEEPRRDFTLLTKWSEGAWRHFVSFISRFNPAQISQIFFFFFFPF